MAQQRKGSDIMEKGGINFYFDQGLFKDSINTNHFDLLGLGFLEKVNTDVHFSFETIKSNVNEGFLYLALDEEDIESILPIEINELIKAI